jgi:dTMP kinase
VLADRYIFTAFARDAVRGCDRAWLRKLYQFARLPDITFFFKVPLPVALYRILSGRPELKYHEAGMDLNLADEPYESFKIFQGRIYEEYKRMWREFDFSLVNAELAPETQQQQMRSILQSKIDLESFRQKNIWKTGSIERAIVRNANDLMAKKL